MEFKMRLTTIALLTAFSVIGCSSGSDSTSGNTPVNTPTGQPGDDPVQTPNPLLGNDPVVLSANNYQEVLTAAVDLLRSEFYGVFLTTLDVAALNWEGFRDSVEGSAVFNCSGGGTVSRDVTTAPKVSGPAIPEYIFESELTFSGCQLDNTTANGTVFVNWEASSPAQLSATSERTTYQFDQFNLSTGNASHTVTGTHERFYRVSGPSDEYAISSDTASYEETVNGLSQSLSSGSYVQTFSHAIAQVDGTFHRFAEAGDATVSTASPELANIAISMEPDLIYANTGSDTDVMHTENIASGEVNLTLTDTSGVRVISGATTDTSTVQYVITDSNGQATTIEGGWISPAKCEDYKDFNYGRC